MADAGDLGGHFENRVRHLTGNHVDLIGIGHGNQHVGVIGAGLFQGMRMGGMADKSLDVEGITDPADQFRRLIDNCYVIVFKRQMTGDMIPDLSGAADDDFHNVLPSLEGCDP